MKVKSKSDSGISFEAERLGSNTQFGTEICCNLIVVQLVEVKGLIRLWDLSESLDRQESLATNVVVHFDTEALKTYKKLVKSFSKNCKNIKSKDVAVSRRCRGPRHLSTYRQQSSIEIRAPRQGKAFISSY